MSAALHLLRALEPPVIGFGFGWLAMGIYERMRRR
jgi:hypothetical protein